MWAPGRRRRYGNCHAAPLSLARKAESSAVGRERRAVFLAGPRALSRPCPTGRHPRLAEVGTSASLWARERVQWCPPARPLPQRQLVVVGKHNARPRAFYSRCPGPFGLLPPPPRPIPTAHPRPRETRRMVVPPDVGGGRPRPGGGRGATGAWEGGHAQGEQQKKNARSLARSTQPLAPSPALPVPHTVKTAISEKALELEGWKELLKNKTWEVSKPNITVRGEGGERERDEAPRAARAAADARERAAGGRRETLDGRTR